MSEIPENSPKKSSGKALIAIGLVAIVSLGGGLAWWLYPKPNKVGPKVEVGETITRTTTTVPPSPFTDVTEEWGVRFRHHTGATGNKLLPETMGSGVVVFDFDNDGKQDIFFVNSCPWPDQSGPTTPCGLYRNKGPGFEDVTKAMGLEKPLYGLGGCAGDFDNDGWTDLFIAAVGGNRLLKNNAGKGFVDVTAKGGLAQGPDWGALPKNNFSQDRQEIPFPTTATFVDFDNDGKLDLFLCHYVTWAPGTDLSIKTTLTGVGRAYVSPTSFEGTQCTLWRNKGNGAFEDVTKSAGIEVTEKEGVGDKARVRAVGKSLGVVVADADNDGWPDIFVANDTVRNFLFHNQSDGKGGRRYKEIGLDSGVAYADGRARAGMGIDWGEYRPGKSGLVVANFSNEPLTFLTTNKPGSLRFSDSALAVGLSGPSRIPMKFGIVFVDYDLDGRLDIFMNNGHLEPDISKVNASQSFPQAPMLFWNSGANPRCFEPVPTTNTGKDFNKQMVGRGSAFADLDGDGDLDLILAGNNEPARILRNDQKTSHHWIRLALEGNGTTTNKNALGAVVKCKVGETVIERIVTGARGYMSQPETEVTLGLGAATAVDWIEITWPGVKPQIQKLEKPKIDQRLVIRQS